MLNPNEAKTVLEAALLAAQEPLTLTDLRRLFEDDLGADTLRRLLDELRVAWQGRGGGTGQPASGWRFQTRPCPARLHAVRPAGGPQGVRAEVVLEQAAQIGERERLLGREQRSLEDRLGFIRIQHVRALHKWEHRAPDWVTSIRLSRTSSSTARKLTTTTGHALAESNSAVEIRELSALQAAQDGGHELAHRQFFARHLVVLRHPGPHQQRLPRGNQVLGAHVGQALSGHLFDPHLHGQKIAPEHRQRIELVRLRA